MAQSAPRLLSVTLSAKTASGFTLLVTGYATGRAITQMDFQLTGVSGENFATHQGHAPGGDAASRPGTRAQSSAQYGSQFTATVPFTLAGEIKDTEQDHQPGGHDPAVSVTLTNRQGVSTARSVDLK